MTAGLKERAEAAAAFALGRATLFGDRGDPWGPVDEYTSVRERNLASLLSELAAAVPSEAAIRSAVEAEREACAVVAEKTPGSILGMWERPGGPPGNGWRRSNSDDYAAAIRARKEAP